MTFDETPEIHRIDEFRDFRIQERMNGVPRGKLLGFNDWRDSFSVVPGSTLFLYGPPASGKTTLKYEILRQLTEYYDWNHVVADPETGFIEHVASKIVKIIAGKDLGKEYKNQMSPIEQAESEFKANEHFMLLDAMRNRLTIKDCFESIKRFQDKTKKKIHTLSIDPWNFLHHDKKQWGAQRDDQYLEAVLPYILQESMKEDLYTIIVNHPRDQEQRSRKVDGELKYYYPPVSPREIGGGQVWYRMGMAMMSLWQPPDWWTDENGEPSKDYEAHVFFQKKKPDGVSEPGDLVKSAKIFWDPKYRRYYEEDGVGSKRYPMNPVKKSIPIPNNLNFDDE